MIKETIAIKVRKKLEENEYNLQIFYELGALEERCQRDFENSEDLLKEVSFLKEEQDLSITNLRKIRKEIREELINTINNEWTIGINYYTLAKLIYALKCLSYETADYKEELNMYNIKIFLIAGYVDLILEAKSNEKDVQKEIEKLALVSNS